MEKNTNSSLNVNTYYILQHYSKLFNFDWFHLCFSPSLSWTAVSFSFITTRGQHCSDISLPSSTQYNFHLFLVPGFNIEFIRDVTLFSGGSYEVNTQGFRNLQLFISVFTWCANVIILMWQLRIFFSVVTI